MIPAIGTAFQAAWPRGSYSHAVLSEQPYRARLRSFLPHLLDEGDVRADGQTLECALFPESPLTCAGGYERQTWNLIEVK